MRVLVCSNAYPPNFIGGAELIAHYQARALQAEGHEILVFAGEGQLHGERHTVNADTFEGIAVQRIFLSHEDFRPDFVSFHKPTIDSRFQAVLDEFRPEIVHFHNLIGLSLGMITVAKEAGVTTVVTLHDNWGFCYRNTMMLDNGLLCSDHSKCAACQATITDARATRIPMELRMDYFYLQLQQVDWFVSPSHYQAENYLRAGIPTEAMTVLSNGVDLERFEKLPRQRKRGITRFTFIGYLGAHKGVALLLKAVARLADKNVRLNLVGSGDERATYQSLTTTLGIESLVHFWGKVPNSRIEDVLAETDVLVLPSLWPENQPVSITEAMASSIPVVGSNAGGIPELVEDGKTGFLFTLGNELELADRLARFASSPELIDQFGKAARLAISKRGFESTVQQLIQLYRKGPRATAINRDYLVGVTGTIGPSELESLRSLQDDRRSTRRFRFVMQDWLSDEQRKWVSFRWLVGPTTSTDTDGQGPFLVPLQNNALMDSIRQNQNGLGYANQEEFIASLFFLRNHRQIASRLVGSEKDDHPLSGAEGNRGPLKN